MNTEQYIKELQELRVSARLVCLLLLIESVLQDLEESREIWKPIMSAFWESTYCETYNAYKYSRVRVKYLPVVYEDFSRYEDYIADCLKSPQVPHVISEEQFYFLRDKYQEFPFIGEMLDKLFDYVEECYSSEYVEQIVNLAEGNVRLYPDIAIAREFDDVRFRGGLYCFGRESFVDISRGTVSKNIYDGSQYREVLIFLNAGEFEEVLRLTDPLRLSRVQCDDPQEEFALNILRSCLSGELNPSTYATVQPLDFYKNFYGQLTELLRMVFALEDLGNAPEYEKILAYTILSCLEDGVCGIEERAAVDPRHAHWGRVWMNGMCLRARIADLAGYFARKGDDQHELAALLLNARLATWILEDYPYLFCQEMNAVAAKYEQLMETGNALQYYRSVVSTHADLIPGIRERMRAQPPEIIDEDFPLAQWLIDAMEGMKRLGAGIDDALLEDAQEIIDEYVVRLEIDEGYLYAHTSDDIYTLLHYFRDPATRDRWSLMERLKELGYHGMSVIYEEALHDENSTVQIEAIRAIGERRQMESVDKLLAFLRETEKSVLVSNLCSVLAELDPRRAIPVMVERLQSSNSMIVNDCIETLGLIGRRTEIPFLEPFLGNPEEAVSEDGHAYAGTSLGKKAETAIARILERGT